MPIKNLPQLTWTVLLRNLPVFRSVHLKLFGLSLASIIVLNPYAIHCHKWMPPLMFLMLTAALTRAWSSSLIGMNWKPLIKCWFLLIWGHFAHKISPSNDKGDRIKVFSWHATKLKSFIYIFKRNFHLKIMLTWILFTSSGCTIEKVKIFNVYRLALFTSIVRVLLTVFTWTSVI